MDHVNGSTEDTKKIAKSPSTTGLIAFLVIALILIIGLVLFGHLALRRLRNPDTNSIFTLSGASKPGVIVGAPLAWRVFCHSGNGMSQANLMYADIAVADLDLDGDDEILLFDKFAEHYDVYELDGSSHPYTGASDHMQTPLNGTWDYDQDGHGERLVKLENEGQVGVLDPAGLLIARIAGDVLWGNARTADFDGDGLEDLFLYDSGTRLCRIIAPGGAEVWSGAMPLGLYNPTFGDTDGDGLAEIVMFNEHQEQLFAVGFNEELNKYPSWDEYLWPGLCWDLDGDGIDEVFASNNGFMNVATGHYTKFEYPEIHADQNTDPFENVVCADLEQDGALELISIGFADELWKTALLFFSLTGECTRYEEVGADIRNFILAYDRENRAHLVLLTRQNLQVYP